MKKGFLIAGAAVCLALLAGSVTFADDGPSFETKWYGMIKLDGSYDQNLTSHGNFVMWVDPRTYDKNDEQFNMTANQSRIGVALQGTDYHNVDVYGKIEFDLYGGVYGGQVPQNRPLLQLRHAYFTVQHNNTKLVAGQTWDLISPLNAPTLNYAWLWGCGNIGYSRAQISLWHMMETGEYTNVTVAGGIFRTIGDNLTPTFSLAAEESAEGADDGTDAGIPSFQGRLDVKYQFPSGGSVWAGFSGLWGQLKAETNFGNYETYKSWAAVGHLEVTFPSGFGFSGEAYQGANLGSYYGGILQYSTIDGVASTGGWAAAWITPAPKVKMAAGIGIDNPKDDDLVSGRSLNSCVFGNVTYAFIPQAKVGLELSNWRTKYLNDDTAKNMRFQSSFILQY